MRPSRSVTLLLFLLLGAALGACSSGSGAGSTGTQATAATSSAPAATPATAATSSAPAATPAPAAGGGKGGYGAAEATPAPATTAAEVNLGDTSLGTVLVDGAGLTLYVFTADSGGTSACTGDCAAKWPPLAGAAAPVLGTGLDAAAFDTITRDDGSAQVTFHGLPLYRFAGDKAAGDVTGQGLGGKWYVVGADGTLVK